MIVPDKIKTLNDGMINADKGLEIDLLDLDEKERDREKQTIEEWYKKLYEILPDYVGQLVPLEIECIEQKE